MWRVEQEYSPSFILNDWRRIGNSIPPEEQPTVRSGRALLDRVIQATLTAHNVCSHPITDIRSHEAVQLLPAVVGDARIIGVDRIGLPIHPEYAREIGATLVANWNAVSKEWDLPDYCDTVLLLPEAFWSPQQDEDLQQ